MIRLILLVHHFLRNCRRPSFSPDGSLLICPTGIYRPFPAKDTGERGHESERKKSFCTHIFTRSQLSLPAISLVDLEEPSTAVRCSPILYKMVQSGGPVAVKPSKLAVASTAGKAGGDVGATPLVRTAVDVEVEVQGESDANQEAEAEVDAMIPGRYRVVFAVVTVSSVLVYDTQHEVWCSAEEWSGVECS